MTKTARVLLLHGRPDDVALWPARRRLIEAFLGVPEENLNWTDHGERMRPLRVADAAGRRVVLTRGLGGQGVTPDFVEKLRLLLIFGAPAGGRPFERPQQEVVNDSGASLIHEADVLAALAARGLVADRENGGWRGATGVAERYVWWPKTKRGVIRCLHLGGFTVHTAITRPIANGNVRSQLEFRGADRKLALAALGAAIDGLMHG